MNNRFCRFFRSLTFKIYGTVVLSIFVLLLANWLLNTFVFADYYRDRKRDALISEFARLDACTSTQTGLQQYLDSQTSDDIALLVWNDFRILYRDTTVSVPDVTGNPFPLLQPLNLQPGEYAVTTQPLREQNTAANLLVLYGRTNSGLNTMLQSSLADIEESTAITNRFLLWSALIALTASGLVLWFLIRSVTGPLSRLSRMAERMAALDFSGRYDGIARDELTQLGNSLNTVSETMETTLAELKTANARLLGDMERTEQQSEARRSFISNVSHELKTPLALIRTYAEGLCENVAEDEEQRRFYCEVIGDEAERLSQMISRMTMLMQLESGKEELQIDRFDIRHLCERLLERYEPLFAERQLTIPPLADSPAFVWGDALLIENVMTNFLTNALNHVEIGGTVRLFWNLTEQETLRITVFNSGSHIPENELPRIWESFYKVDKARTRAYGGTGIGLSVVAAIMRVHHMPYGVRNTEDGVEFFIELPTK